MKKEERVVPWETLLTISLDEMPNLLPKLLEKLGNFRWDTNFAPPQRPSSRENVTFTTQDNMYEERQSSSTPPLEPIIKRLIRGALPTMGCDPPPSDP